MGSGSMVSVSMVKTVFLLSTIFAVISADVFTAEKSFNVKSGGTTKKAICSFSITYSGDTASKADSSLSCSIPWPKAKALSSSVTKSFTVGDVTGMVFTADASFYPASLWCPQEDTIIFGSGKYENVVNEAPADSYDQCAQRCSEFKTETGNAPCFSWTFNSNSESVLGLSGGTCRLLAYMEVSSMEATGVQSGYHKCWNAMPTSTAP